MTGRIRGLHGAEVPPQRNSYGFALRLWLGEAGAGHIEWRGRVQSLSTGEVYYFKDWQALAAVLMGMLPSAEEPAEQGANTTSNSSK